MMDPEQLREFEESLRRINEMLAQQSSLQAGMLKTMQDQLAAQKAETTATVANTGAKKGEAAAGEALTKIAEAEAKAKQKQIEATQNYTSALHSGHAALTSFTAAIVSGEKGFTKYGSAVSSAGDAAWSLGKNFGVAGMALGGLTAVATKLIAVQFQQLDAQIKLKDQFSKMGQIGGGTTTELANLAKQAGYSYLDLQKLTKPLQTAGMALQSMNSAGQSGAEAFLKMADVGKETRMRFERLGVSQEELTGMQAEYVSLQRLSGAAFRDQAKDAEKLKKNSLEYANQLVTLSTLTGKNVEQLQAEERQARLTFEEAVQTRKESARIRQLESEAKAADAAGNKELAAQKRAEASKVETEQKNRQSFIREMAAKFGPEYAQQLAKVARTGAFDESTKGLANLGLSAGQIKAMAAGGSKEDLNKLGDQINAGIDRKVTTMGTALQFGGEELGRQVGVTKDVLENTAGQQGTSAAEERKAAEEKVRIQAENRNKEGKVIDAALEKRTALTEAEIAAKTALDSMVGSISGSTIALGAMIAALGLATLALGKFAASAAMGGLPGGRRGPKARRPSGKPRKGADGRWRDSRGRFTKPPSGLATGGKLLRFGRGLAGGVGGLLGGLALDYGAEKAEAAGHKKTAAGLSAASSAVTGAGIGATVGSIIPGVGTLIGGAVGGAIGGGIGLWQNRDKLFGGGEEKPTARPAQGPTPRPAPKPAAAVAGTTATAAAEKELELKNEGIDKQSTVNDLNATTIERMKTGLEVEEVRSKTQGIALDRFIGALDSASNNLNRFQTELNNLASIIQSMGTGAPSAPGAPGDTGGGGAAAPADIGKYMAATAMIESGGNANARAKTSSAGGMFQFLDSTWKELVREMGKNYSVQDKFDPKKAAEVMAYFTQKQKKQLERGTGRRATNTDLYMAHFLGSGGAIKFLNAMQQNPNAIAAELDPRAAKANRNIYYDGNRARTLKEVYDLMGSKMSKAETQVAGGKVPDFVRQMAAASGPVSPGGGPSNLPKSIGDLLEFGGESGTQRNFEMLDPGMQQAVIKAARDYKAASGKKIKVNSARRSREDQERLYNAWVARGKTGMPAARPGRSLHERGDAIDIQNYGDPEAVQAFNRNGLFQTVRGDPVHFQLSAADGAMLDGPMSGFPVDLTAHGTEIIAPLQKNSILMQLANTPLEGAGKIDAATALMSVLDKNSVASTTETSTAPAGPVTKAADNSDRMMSMNAEMMQMIASKLDAVIETLAEGNDTNNKLLKRSSV